MAELLLGQPLLSGESGIDQLVESIKARARCLAGASPGGTGQSCWVHAGRCVWAACESRPCRMLVACQQPLRYMYPHYDA